MELTDNDKQRIHEAYDKWDESTYYVKYTKKGAFLEGAEYATIYEREQQAKVGNTIDETVQIYLPDEYYADIRSKLVPAIQRLLEAERRELVNLLTEIGFLLGPQKSGSQSEIYDKIKAALNSIKTK